jgi:hypothetical protein
MFTSATGSGPNAFGGLTKFGTFVQTWLASESGGNANVDQ